MSIIKEIKDGKVVTTNGNIHKGSLITINDTGWVCVETCNYKGEEIVRNIPQECIEYVGPIFIYED
jgi:hypothetical protein